MFVTQVVWVTATMPYVILAILLIRGIMLPGSTEGVKYFIIPRPDRLLDAQVGTRSRSGHTNGKLLVCTVVYDQVVFISV